MTSWYLEDVDARMGGAADLEVRPGDDVALVFVRREPGEGPRAELLWVRVEHVEEGRLEGRLRDAPRTIADLAAGDPVVFGPQHVTSALVRRAEPEGVDPLQEAFVTRHLLRGAPCAFLYREPAQGPLDSGWRLFTGTETPAELDHPDTAQVCTLGFLLDREPALAAVLGAPVGSAFERAEAGEFRVVHLPQGPEGG